MTNEDYIRLLKEEVILEYSSLDGDANFSRQPRDRYDLALRRFVSTLVLLSEACDYKPEGLSDSDIKSARACEATQLICKVVLADCTLNEALIGLDKPVDLSRVYRKTFDPKYIYVPRNKRPGPDFMNPPEEV